MFARQELMLRISERYFDVLRARDQLAFAESALEAFGQQLKQAQQRFEVGLIAITDVEEAQSGFDLATADVIAAENDLDNAREALREVTGIYTTDLASLGEAMPLVSPDPGGHQPVDGDRAAAEPADHGGAPCGFECQGRDRAGRIPATTPPWISPAAPSTSTPTAVSAASRRTNQTVDGQIGLEFTLPIYEGRPRGLPRPARADTSTSSPWTISSASAAQCSARPGPRTRTWSPTSPG